MKVNLCKKIAAGLLSAAMLCSAATTVSAVNIDTPSVAVTATTSSDVIFETGFEDGEGISEFTGRGDVETIEAVTTDSYSGDYSMLVSGKTATWNGPQILLDDRCEAGVEYTAGAYVKTAWYSTVTLSMEYTDTSGTRHYSNLYSVISQGDWVQIPATKFSFTDDVTNVYLYIEGSDTVDLYVDDFVIAAGTVYEIEQDIPSLKDVYSSYFKIGTAVTTSELAPQATKDLIEKHFNSITLGNELKPDALLDQEASIAAGNENPQISLASARTILNYCRDNNISVRGHVLVWHSQTPDWFFKENYDDDGDWVSEEVMLARMENYIKNVFAAIEEEYPTVDFYAWDVVNEAWLDDGSVRTGGAQSENSNYSGWVKVFGDNSFIEYAFEYARKYAPEGCKLYYNDYNEYITGKTDTIVEMALDLKEKGLIDGIGMQSHLDARSGSDAYPSVSAYRKALAAFAATGLDIQITELDATIVTNQPTDENFEGQAQYYSDIMDAIVEYSDYISAVVFWGTTDDRSWRATGYPLLFNEDYTAKPCFYSIVDGIEYETDPTEATTEEETTEATTEEETEEETTETTNAPGILYGDANLDGTITISDAVAILSYVSNSGKYPLSDEALDCSDVNQRGNGLSNMDATAVQKYISNTISALPES